MRSRRRKPSPIVWIAGFALITLLVLAVAKPVAVPTESLRFPVGAKVKLSDVITDVKLGSLSEPDRVLESNKAGSIKILFTMKNLLKIERKGEILVEFYNPDGETDESKTKEEKPSATLEKPVITSPEKLYAYVGEELDLTEGITAADSKGNPLPVKLTGNYDLQTAGDYKLVLEAVTAEGVKGTKNVTLSVLKTPFGEKGTLIDGSYTTKNGKSLEVRGGIAYAEGVLIANKSYSLPKSYTSSYLTKDAESAYYAMSAGAKQAGHTLKIKSAYRSWNDQNYIFNGYVRDDGLENALTYSARPGHSEHQTGLGMDLITSSSEAAQKPEYKVILDWLSQHAHEYGFVLRYPNGKSHITGYIYEPWHYRYVGKELAAELYNGGDWITLEEYFGIDSRYRGY